MANRIGDERQRPARWELLAGRAPCTRRITLFGNSVLHRKTEPVVEFDAALRHLVDSMFATMYATGNGVGLAAPQIGVGLQVFVFDCGGDDIGYVINPRLLPGHGEMQNDSEGCLSIPGVWLETPRFMDAHVQGVDVNGVEVEYSGSGLLGRCLQHESDHLRGRLFIETHSPKVRRSIEGEIRDAEWFGLDSIEPTQRDP